MNKIFYKIPFIILVFGLILFHAAAFGASAVSANVKVICPFNLSVNSNSLYVRYSNITFNYSAVALSNCSVGELYGYFNVSNVNATSLEYTKNISINLNNMYKGVFSINSTLLKQGVNEATLLLNSSNAYNKTTKTFFLENPANIIIGNLSIDKQIQQNSEFYVNFYIQNVGDLSSNNIKINMNISGPTDMSQNFSEPALSSNEIENLNILEPFNSTALPGKYNITISVYYSTYGYAYIHDVYKKYISYNVSELNTPHTKNNLKIPPIGKITTIPQININTAPLYISTATGVSSTAQINFENPTNSLEIINLTVDPTFKSFVKISSNSVYLYPGGSLGVQLAFIPNYSITKGFYVIPLNITTQVVNGSVNRQQEFITLNLNNNSNGGLNSYTQITEVNNTKNINETIEITPKKGSTLYNTTLTTLLPLSVTGNISNIHAYGAANNITTSNEFYNINWNLSGTYGNASVFLYYNIKNLKDQQAVQNFQNIFTKTNQKGTVNLLHIIKIDVPVMYTNSSNNITISFMYTGSETTNVTSNLYSLNGVYIKNPLQQYRIFPNQMVKDIFNIQTNSSYGTMLFNLNIQDGYSQYNYTIPLIVEQKIPPQNKISEINTTLINNNINFANYDYYIVIVPTLIVIIVAILLVKIKQRPMYNTERASELRRIKDQIDRKG